MKRLASLSVVVGLLVTGAGADWLQFRGTNHDSRATATKLPTQWDVKEKKNVAWAAALAGKGVSGPIVAQGKVFVTSDSGVRRDRLHVIALDTTTGERCWERQFWATGRTLCHPTSAVAAPTPASDGERVFAFYSSNDLACLDLDGNLLWYRGLANDFPLAGNDVGMSSSPVVAERTVVVQIENQGDSFAAGLNVVTGETRWRIPRQRGANWASPSVLRKAGKNGGDLVLLQSPAGISAHDPQTGEELWKHAAGCSIIPSATPLDGLVLVPAGGLTALSVQSGAEPKVAWTQNKLGPGAPSPLVSGEKIFVINSAGVLVCGDLKSGEVRWQLRLGGKFWATPVIAGDQLYAVSDAGKVQVVKIADDMGEIVSEVELGESVLGSPAVDGSAIYFRSDAQLWKIAEKP